jgi:hypothetical protein
MAKTIQTPSKLILQANWGIVSERLYVEMVSVPLPYKAPRPPGVAIAQTILVQSPVSTRAANAEDVTPALQGYELRDADRVTQFLHGHTHLITLLIEARDRIREYFPESPLVLEVADDPEAAGSQLVAIIIVSSSPDDVAERLERFDRAWWLGAIRRARGDLCITVEFA